MTDFGRPGAVDVTSKDFMQMLHESPRHGSEEPEHMRQVKNLARQIAMLGTPDLIVSPRVHEQVELSAALQAFVARRQAMQSGAAGAILTCAHGMPAKQDQQAARQRRARIHRGILDRWNEVARPLGWAVENETEDAGPAQTGDTANAHSVHVGANGGDATCAASSSTACPPSSQAGGQASEMDGGESRRPSEPLLAVAANVAGTLGRGEWAEG